MPVSKDPEQFQSEIVSQLDPVFASELSGTPFSIAVIGDFSGSGASRTAPPRGPIEVDRDNLDEVLALLRPQFEWWPKGLPEPLATINFEQIDDFHPDNLFDRMPIFRSVVEGAIGAGTTAAAAAPPPRANLLEEMLEEAEGKALPVGIPSVDSFQEYLRRLVSPHLERPSDPQRLKEKAKGEAAAGALLRSLLADPGFQALESAWRGLDFLVRRLQTDSHLRVSLIDVSKEYIAADLGGVEDVSQSGFYRLLARSAGQERPWALLAGLYFFGPEPEDLSLLEKLGYLAWAMGAPWVSAAKPDLVGCDSLAETPDPEDWRKDQDPNWVELRRNPIAYHLGLVLPRILLRLPYGRETAPCDRLPFEEMESHRHDGYLWGNGALACAFLLGESFRGFGWKFRPGVVREIENLPLHVYQTDGESLIQPCAEVLLTDGGVSRMLDSGVMPLISARGGDQVRLHRFQSIADPPSLLLGPWSG